ncbi:hypothetical protein HCA73_06455 [Listeria booriae]|uniref:hypothetical protein n=1 Tax=Listeria booriae TaxID=1552123 RepID=UPI001624DA07|nr:hypothetical protein [Listeria booriae]MBC1892596.1 hypothetical protein [Listeria booriae]MBC1912281.1 hypothetical protein [Listeria booriae]
MKQELKHGWTITSNQAIRAYQDVDGNLAIFTEVKEFGDPMPLLIDLSEDEAKVKAIPHMVNAVHVKLTKEIEVVWNSEYYQTVATEAIYEEE